MYYGVSICLVSFASAMAVVTLNVHFRGLRGAEVPSTVKKVFLSGLARVVFMQFSPSFERAEKSENPDTFEQRMKVIGGCGEVCLFIMIVTVCRTASSVTPAGTTPW